MHTCSFLRQESWYAENIILDCTRTVQYFVPWNPTCRLPRSSPIQSMTPSTHALTLQCSTLPVLLSTQCFHWQSPVNHIMRVMSHLSVPVFLYRNHKLPVTISKTAMKKQVHVWLLWMHLCTHWYVHTYAYVRNYVNAFTRANICL